MRILRVFVWTIFGLVLVIRFTVHKSPQPVPDAVFWNQQQRQPGMGMRHPPTLVRPPVAEIPPDLPRIQIQIAPNDVQTLRGYFWNGWRGQRVQRPEVLATIREGDLVYTNVALHLKGAAGSFRPFDDKPALTLNFGKRAPGQRFHQYSKMSLNNSVQDPTYLCEALCREIYNAAGVPAPRASWATVVLNGRDLGLYVMVEGWNKDFLRHHFKNVKGNLYDGGFVQEVNPNLDVNSGDHPEDHSDIERLLEATREPPQTRWARLGQVLDLERFITLLDLEVMMCHWDGYALNRNNFRLYHDLDIDRMVFMPHGMDQMFDFPPHRFPPDGPIQPAMRGRVAIAVLGTPEGSRRYLERMAELQTNFFQEEVLVGRARELAQHIRPTLAAYSPSLAQWHDAAVASLCDRISQRIRSVSEQLDRPRQGIEFDASGTAHVAAWNQPFRQGSTLRLDTTDDNRRRLLHIAVVDRGGTASWRTRVQLEGGQYRLEGRARVSQDALGSRICLRISGAHAPGQVITSTDWVPLSHTFPVEGFPSEVTLVCEFTGSRGEAWFDVDSLRLIRE